MYSRSDIADFLGKWTLIVGDVNTGKTTIAAKMLKDLCDAGLSPRIAIVDLAPEITGAFASGKKMKGVGGRLAPPPMTGVVCLSTRLDPPRLSSRNDEEAVTKAKLNAEKIDELFEEFNGFSRDILFVNDVSMYLQAGTAEKLVRLMEKASTLIANGYYGEKLGSGIVSERERREMEALMEYVEKKGQVIWEK